MHRSGPMLQKEWYLLKLYRKQGFSQGMKIIIEFYSVIVEIKV